MRSIAFLSPKGGAGKTTAALLLALGLAERGDRVALIDSDPNKPLMHWSSLPARPDLVTVHPAPTQQDIRDALREAQRKNPEWIILDTEGSVRGAMVFTSMKIDLAITPLAASQLETIQAINAAELVERFGARAGRPRHRALLTRVPTSVSPEALKLVVEQLRAHEIEILPTPLIEKEAFRTLFVTGGGLRDLETNGAPDVAAARRNALAFVAAVTGTIETPSPG